MGPKARLALLAHCLVMIVLPLGLTAATYVGVHRGVGPSGWLQADPMAAVGLAQAYLLMALVSGLVWLRSTADNEIGSRIAMILAHCVPLSAVFTFWEILGSHGFADIRIVSLAIHLPWIALELGLIAHAARHAGREVPSHV